MAGFLNIFKGKSIFRQYRLLQNRSLGGGIYFITLEKSIFYGPEIGASK